MNTFLGIFDIEQLFGCSYQPPLPAELVKPLADFDEEGGGMCFSCLYGV